MPLNPMNFQPQQNTDWSNLSNLFGNVQKGYDAAAHPHKAAQEYLSQALQQKLLGTQVKQAQQQADLFSEMFGISGDTFAQNYSGGGGTPAPAGGGIGTPGVPMDNQGGAVPGQASAQPGTQQGGKYNFSPETKKAFQEAYLRHTGHIGEPKAMPLPGGETLIYDPLKGGWQVVQLGSRPEDVESRKTRAVEEAKRGVDYEHTLEDRISSERSKRPLFEVLQQATNSPEFLFGTGSVSSRLAAFTGGKDVNAMLATVDSSLGELVNRASTQFKNLNKSEFEALNRIKGNTSQNPYALKAKIDLQNALSQHREAVDVATLENMQEYGMKRAEAEAKAYKDTNYSEIQDVINTDNLAHKLAGSTKSKYEDILSAAYDVQRETGRSLHEILRDFK